MYDLIIIGAGPGGYEAAIHAGRKGKKTLLFERESIGGTCLNVGCIPTKTLLRSAHVFSLVREAGKYGVSAGNATLQMAQVQERKNKIVSALGKGIEASLKKAGVEILRAHAKLANRGKVEADGKTYEAANILIATGARPALPPVPGIESAMASTAALKLAEVPASIAIIGGGVIGLEFADFFAQAGSKVTVVEMLPSIAPMLDTDMGKRLLSALKRKGIEFHLSAKVTRVEAGALHFTDEKGVAQTINATKVLNATGRKPVVNDLGLEAAGVEFSGKGIVTSDEGRTNVPGIWACGDVTGRLLLAHAATREGLVAVENMFGGTQRIRYDAIPSVVYTDPEVASCGKTEEQLLKEGVPFRKALVPMGVAGRFLVEHEGQAGTLKVLVGKEHGEILGVHILGGPAGELIFGAAIMMENEMRGKDLFEIVFPHPTISEALKEAILHAE
ncbi:MAG: dihydrolipoyl dehydrogenase [Fibrobacterota bacterium]